MATRTGNRSAASGRAIHRRRFLGLAAGSVGAAAALGLDRWAGAPRAAEPAAPDPQVAGAALPPIRALTTGPKFHWFGYYDKLQFDPASRYVLGMEVDFEGRSPTADDPIRVGMIDLEQADRWIELGTSRAWCWQQGCMLQWLPGSKTEVLWNDREGERFVCHVLDVASGRRRTIPHPVYSVAPDGRTAVVPDFRRIQDMRPGYGYPGAPDPFRDQLAPDDSGIWRVDLVSGQSRLIVSLSDVARRGDSGGGLASMKHWFNHLLVGPGGERFIFLHRCRREGESGFHTRMFTARLDGSDLRLIDASGATSHFIWRDAEHILAWTRHGTTGDGFYLFEDKPGGRVEPVGRGVMTVNGHCTYLPGGEWILNDTYPRTARRLQEVYLYHVASGRRVELGAFHSPASYQGEWRCDTHPRCSPDGRWVCIDSPHGGQGRQLWLIDIGAIVQG